MNTKGMNFVSKIIVLNILGIILISCNNGHREKLAVENVSISSEYDAVSEEQNEIETPNITKLPDNLKIIKSASLRYKVKQLKKASKEVNVLINQFQGYISEQRSQNDLSQKENRLIIKVPNHNFTTLIDSLSIIAEFIDFENITTQDITEEYIDIQSRLKTKLEVKERYETILRKNAKNVEDILATEAKLGAIQEEIEAAQGRLKYLSNKVTFSTVELSIYETVDYKEQPNSFSRSFFSEIKEGFSFGWNLIKQIILGVVYLWPLLIIGGVVTYFVKRRMIK
ncbi:DUF4349 domain-containing protein [Aureibaculum sp. A20]|uniref:DUF4349 domain-containing protein n=1 Tax=Aureibaculum flavum TaxID=2795986 RepID=A0ABS0WTM5_9FLAO|nr:DUF4349 domain-containing protein [Aureibaculum flavum]MBJ2175300.1 DUF4349 domain-containing protein [Aureibaculum flavum]